MFSIIWSDNGNYPMLVDTMPEELRINPPRPVFFEELDLFGLDQYWDYPKSEAPLLWAIGRSYYYKGVKVASIKGGNLSSDPDVEVLHKGKLKPVNIISMITDNLDRLETLENEAKFFISKTQKSLTNNEQLCVAYSGGKDSQVVLELVSQVIPPSDYIVVYTDTGMELPNNSRIVMEALKGYKKLYPELVFETAKANQDIVELWRFFGHPSRMHRWCCSVAKSIPFYITLSKLSNQSAYVVFEGVRREESNARRNYDRTANQVKHSSVKNARPIIDWNDTEVYLYLFYSDRKINPLYRYGLTRVGCSICPFSSDWSEYIISKLDPNINERFYNVIYDSFNHNGISDESKREKYIKEGKWKVRGGDKVLSDIGCSSRTVYSDGVRKVKIKNPRSSLFEWLKVFDHHLSKRNRDSYDLMISDGAKAAFYQVNIETDGIMVTFIEGNHQLIDQKMTKLLNKVTYCYHCLACVVECPSNAISFNPNVKIDQNLCTRCHNCLNAIANGCLVASSRSVSLAGENMNKKTKNPDRYSTFGLRENWLLAHLKSDNDWFDTLGKKQIPAVKRWLYESELINKDNKTELSHLLSQLPIETVWGVVWINLCFNSEIVGWYSKAEYKNWDRHLLQTMLAESYPNHSEGTLSNPFGALMNMLDQSEILSYDYGQGIVKKKGNRFMSVNKVGVSGINNHVLLYALYRFGRHFSTNTLTLNQLFISSNKPSLANMFGIDESFVKMHLTSLQEHRSKLVRVEFAANLDNIFLVKDISPTEALRIYLEG